MDPNATLSLVLLAAIAGDAEGLRDHAEALAEWIEKRGFLPTLRGAGVVPIVAEAAPAPRGWDCVEADDRLVNPCEGCPRSH